MTSVNNVSHRSFLGLMGATGTAGVALGLFGCAQSNSQSSAASSSSASSAQSSSAVALDASAWSYDSDNDVYYQIGVQYCEKPQAPNYESMGIYVPGAYFDATDNGNGTFTCKPSSSGKVGSYTASSAPIVMPINTAGYSAQAAPTSYNANGVTTYLEAGFVYVFAGCRGRGLTDNACGAAPWGVTDLKAAVRTLRYNDSLIPGDKNRIFSMGMSGGGAQSAVLGVSGDAKGYDDYLAAIGAPTADASGNALSDAIFGSMCWCPITCLMSADAAYEWNMGQFASSGTRAQGTFSRQLSLDLASEYASYINTLGLVDEKGAALKLADGGEGVATSGTYYDYVVAQVEKSLNNFLADTTFPYTPSNSFNADMGAGGGGTAAGGAMGGRGGAGGADGAEGKRSQSSGSAPSGEPPSGEASSGDSSTSGRGAMGGFAGGQSGTQDSTTYETVADYIAHLNGESPWITYNEATNTATITGLSGFVNACKSPSKDVGAFDAFDRSQAENAVFGNDSNEGLHFDDMMAVLLARNADAYAALSNWDATYPSAYADDRKYVDAQGKSSDFRQEIYDPLYYLSSAYEGEGTSSPAAHWRIRTGITQGDTASTTEINLALALAASKQVNDVDFATVWGLGHTMAERTGSSTENFIAWVNDCCK
ncbi:MAG: esterase [Eggerthellaceae bacterium]|nr:esterase [Eggerthellaceae bacterium]